MLKYHITMDFCADYSRLVRYWMKKQGIQSDKNDWELWYEYFNYQKKSITPKKRNVRMSKEFICPQKHKKGLELLIQKFEKGEDVSKHLSKMARNPSCPDQLLYDWGIYHFHLGENINSQTGYIERTGSLLFARIDEESVYLINIYEHGNWSKQEMVTILYSNWPDSIEPYRISEAWSIEEFTDEEYAAARRAHEATLAKADKNAVYGFLGGGYTSSGHSLQVVSFCDNIYNWFKELETDIKRELPRVIKYIEKLTGKPPSHNLHFMLWSERDGIHIVELFSHAELTRLDF